MDNENNNEKKLTKMDRVNMFIRSNLQQASFNYERIHGLGFCFDMVPAIKRLYSTKEERIKALKSHLVFFNVTPGLVGPILGITAAMEETKANGADIEESSINSLKVGLMGPLAGVGDPIMWGTLRPIMAALGASMALSGSILGPLIFFIGFNAVRLALLWFGLEYGYRKGLDVVKDLAGNTLQKMTEGASILGLFVMGALVSKWTKINVPLVVSKTTGSDGKQVITTVQTILDQLLPGLLALILTLVICKLLKKKISPIALIFILFAVGIVGYWLGILS
ncbi:sorbose permease IID component [Clostridium pasteurianum DSM 525 = ATCC 6013]|uniref:PTS system, mannose/fructose/sorbose family, IID subunit n=1 Tax=Clostridium pasteurianum DSM 525 = ATCC 6013 TaxID=1262449 RepID=A0A0H3J9T7_CLOPA|nr:mannose/fructose/sorbose PTS transporter subunit IID [Clostridium pasteurianum]AJA48963.1 sorbose permease IID component [Clostridium pasteurianum DSM 525 = ATCC 6013]AJA52951.1 sorbose permease IID component [Clostridium pasteurianum DSM 525 = ATCC 6013]AOZ76170.1 PTS mannose transporter subunit IID [Clostridium pasteurianum DSM 525 = ATCC 6013]AOZ79966.1 PTS mannose transporter subunit IID [Clostridium pasteurianum]ELP60259.1 sorbose-specific PTS uptake system, component [Clostridium past